MSPDKINKNHIEFCQKWCRGPEKSQKSGVVQRKKCRARKTLKNAALDEKIGVHTAENEPRKGSKKMGSLKDPVGYIDSDKRTIC